MNKLSNGCICQVFVMLLSEKQMVDKVESWIIKELKGLQEITHIP